MDKIYYTVAGTDGFGVYSYIEGARKIAEYITGVEITKCSSFLQAFSIARDTYNNHQEYRDVADAFYGSSVDIKPNEILFRSKIRKMNKEA